VMRCCRNNCGWFAMPTAIKLRLSPLEPIMAHYLVGE
jgi:hypothetical protein